MRLSSEVSSGLDTSTILSAEMCPQENGVISVTYEAEDILRTTEDTSLPMLRTLVALSIEATMCPQGFHSSSLSLKNIVPPLDLSAVVNEHGAGAAQDREAPPRSPAPQSICAPNSHRIFLGLAHSRCPFRVSSWPASEAATPLRGFAGPYSTTKCARLGRRASVALLWPMRKPGAVAAHGTGFSRSQRRASILRLGPRRCGPFLSQSLGRGCLGSCQVPRSAPYLDSASGDQFSPHRIASHRPRPGAASSRGL